MMSKTIEINRNGRVGQIPRHIWSPVDALRKMILSMDIICCLPVMSIVGESACAFAMDCASSAAVKINVWECMRDQRRADFAEIDDDVPSRNGPLALHQLCPRLETEANGIAIISRAIAFSKELLWN